MENISKTSFPACGIYNGEMYYITHVEHAFKRMNLLNGKAHYINNPTGYYPLKWSGVDRWILNNEKIYLFEQNGNRVLEYSLLENNSRCFDIKCNINSCDNYAAQTIYNNKLYIFSKYANKLTIIELETGEVRKEEFVLMDKQYIYNKDAICFMFHGEKIKKPYGLFSCGCQIGKVMWLFAEQEQFAIIYDFSTENYKKVLLPESIEGCIHAIWKNGLFYILTIEGNIYTWDIKHSEIKVIFKYRGKMSYLNLSKIVVTDKNIWCLPAFGDDIVIISGEKVNIYDSYPADFKYHDNIRSRYYEYCEDRNNYYFAMHSANYILCINKDNGEERWFRPIEPEIEEKIRYHIKNISLNMEELEFGIKGLFMALKENLDYIHEDENNFIGKKLWSTLK